MEHKGILVTGLAAILVTTMACSFTGPGTFMRGGVRGSGNLVEQTFEVSNFDSVTLAGIGNLYIEQGDSEELVVEAEDNIMPLLDIKVEGDQLILSFKPNTSINESMPISFHLKVKQIAVVRIMGSGNVQMDDIDADELNLQITGSGDIMINDLQAERFRIEVPGSGEIDISGQANNQNITILGSADYDGENFATASTTINIAGSGNVTVRASDELDVRIAGNGNVNYIGDPQVTQSIFGSGDIKQIGE